VRVVGNTFIWNACAHWILCSFVSYISCFYPISEQYYPNKTLLLQEIISHVVFWIWYSIFLIGVNCWLKVWPCRCNHWRKHFLDFSVHFAWSCWLCEGWDLLQWLLPSCVAVTLAMIQYMHIKAYQKWQQINFHASPVSIIINLTWLRDAWLYSLS